MPARHVIYALYLFIAAMFLQLIAPPTASAANWNSDPVPTTQDAATVDFWQACHANATPDTSDFDGYISFFAWTDYDHDTQSAAPDSGIYCATVHYAPDETTVISLSIAFYRGSNLDADWLTAKINADVQE